MSLISAIARRIRAHPWLSLVVLYGMLNAAAYSCLLPLWEGFDEAYHYGYVQTVSTEARFPTMGETMLSEEIWRSFELVPVSHYIQPFTGAPLSFADYFAKTPEQRTELRHRLESLPPLRAPQQGKQNYEA